MTVPTTLSKKSLLFVLMPVVILGVAAFTFWYIRRSGEGPKLSEVQIGMPCNQAATTTPCPTFAPDVDLASSQTRLIASSRSNTISSIITPSWVFVQKEDGIHAEYVYGSQVIEGSQGVRSPYLESGGAVYTDSFGVTRKMLMTDRGVIQGIEDPGTFNFVLESESYLKDADAIYFLSAHPGAAWDRGTFSISKVSGADSTSFRILDGRVNLATDRARVYVDGKVETDIDTKTFARLIGYFYKDKHKLYRFGLAEGNGRVTIERTSLGEVVTRPLSTATSLSYYQDSSVVYYQGDYPEGPKVISGADPNTFVLLVGFLEQYGGGIDGPFIAYARDAKRVYYKGVPLPDANPATFRPIENGIYIHSYGSDGTHVYFGDKRIIGADAATFVILWQTVYEGCGLSPYAKDAKQVYFKDKPVPGADVATFEALKSGEDPRGLFGSFGKDKRGIYRETEFRADLPKTFEPVCNYG